MKPVRQEGQQDVPRTACKHPHIVSYSGANGPEVWACAQCSRRFYFAGWHQLSEGGIRNAAFVLTRPAPGKLAIFAETDVLAYEPIGGDDG